VSYNINVAVSVNSLRIPEFVLIDEYNVAASNKMFIKDTNIEEVKVLVCEVLSNNL
jgi:hypothetical protein